MTTIRRTGPAVAVARALLEKPDEPAHGYDLGNRTGYSNGTVFPVLQRFAALGWITPDTAGPIAPGRRRRMWRFTDTGAADMRAWLASAPERNRAARRAADDLGRAKS